MPVHSGSRTKEIHLALDQWSCPSASHDFPWWIPGDTSHPSIAYLCESCLRERPFLEGLRIDSHIDLAWRLSPLCAEEFWLGTAKYPDHVPAPPSAEISREGIFTCEKCWQLPFLFIARGVIRGSTCTWEHEVHEVLQARGSPIRKA